MKKLLSLLLLLCLSVSLSACSVNKSTANNNINSFCFECGGNLSSDDKFCSSCGASIIIQNSSPITTDNTTNDSNFSSEYDINIHTTTEYTATIKIETTKPIATTKNETIKPVVTTKAETTRLVTTTKIETTKPIVTTKTETTRPVTTTKASTTYHIHNYSNPTCTTPAKCFCGETNGSALGHNYNNASCTSPQKCSRCGVTTGSALGHSYSNGVCSRCGVKDDSYIKTYSVGETWVVDGQWEFTVNSVTTHNLCNTSYNSKEGYTNEQVIIIDYTYKNIGYTGNLMDLYMGTQVLQVYDEKGVAADIYACTHSKPGKECVIGTSCTAREDFVLTNNSSEITLVVGAYTSNGTGRAQAKFELPVM